MSLIFLCSIGLLGVAPMVSGPDQVAKAAAIEAPIRAVTVYGDHAEITRRGTSPSQAGILALRLPDLPGETRLDTLRVEAPGAQVVRVEAQPVERNRASIDQVEALLDAIEALQADLALSQAERAVVMAEVGFLGNLQPTLAVPEHERPGAPVLAPAAWAQVVAWQDERRATSDQRLLTIDEEIRKKNEGLAEKKAELGRFDQRAFSAQRIELVVWVEQPAAVPVEVRYLLPGASWAPVYRIERAPGQDTLTLSTAGQVIQTTGEDWVDVAVTLSTAQPGRRIEVPELLTWTLGEQRDFLPRPVARQGDRIPALPMPALRPTVVELEEAQALRGLQGRVALASGQVDVDHDGILDLDDRCPTDVETLNGRQDEDGCPDAALAQVSAGIREDEQAKKEAQFYAEDAEKAVMDAPAPPPPPEPMAEYAPADGSTESREETRMGVAFGGETSVLGGAASEREPAQSMAMDLFDTREVGRGPFGADGSPAALAGGLDYQYPAVTPMTLRSQPEAQVVPLAVETWPITPFYQVVPGIKETAFLKAVVRNQGLRPVLGGAVNIFVGTDFIGQGQLVTTGPGGELELPLGADEDLAIVRRVVPRTVTEGVFSKEEVTTYKTTVEVRNDKKKPVRVRVVEQVPLTNDQDTQVKVGAMTPKPVEPPDREGIMAFLLEIAPGATAKVDFEYTLIRPVGHQLRQR